ncbi:hypothetical protein VPH35_056458 [Triticum aestivum]
MRPTKARSSRDRMNNLPWTASSFVLASSVGSSTELITNTCEVASSPLTLRRNIHGGGNQLACWRALDAIMDDRTTRSLAGRARRQRFEGGRLDRYFLRTCRGWAARRRGVRGGGALVVRRRTRDFESRESETREAPACRRWRMQENRGRVCPGCRTPAATARRPRLRETMRWCSPPKLTQHACISSSQPSRRPCAYLRHPAVSGP